MHDLLQQMGKEIVQQESEQRENRSRIWCYEDSYEVLTRNMVQVLLLHFYFFQIFFLFKISSFYAF